MLFLKMGFDSMTNEHQKRLDESLEKIKNLKEVFLKYMYDPDQTPETLKSRFNYLNEVIGDGLDPYFICNLFLALEQKAIVEVDKMAALAQTIDPDALRKYGIPDQLIENAKAAKNYDMKLKSHNAGKKTAEKFKSTENKARKIWEDTELKSGQFTRYIVDEGLAADERTVRKWVKNWSLELEVRGLWADFMATKDTQLVTPNDKNIFIHSVMQKGLVKSPLIVADWIEQWEQDSSSTGSG